MKKIERRSVICLLLAALLGLGLVLFVGKYVIHGDSWVAFAANRHLYNSAGQLAVGRVLDRDGDVLSWVKENGTRTYYANPTVRKATLHAVGDREGRIGSGALVAFADELSGYNLLSGAYTPQGTGNDLYLTLDARYNYIAYNALNGHKGAVGVYNYQTGEILCMVSSPAFDPLDPPVIRDGDDRWEGVYLNRFLSGTFPPGSVFKTVTLEAALEQIPDLEQRVFSCDGAAQVGEEIITCTGSHGEQTIQEAFANSCNGVFASLAAELGARTLEQYARDAGLLDSYSVDGIPTAKGRIDLSGAAKGELGWAGVGQHRDLINPCSLMVYMGAIANGGKAAVPRLILKTESPGVLPTLPQSKAYTGRLVREKTAERLAELMSYNVVNTYGAERFPNMDLCAKSGTAEVGGGENPHSWFTGFLRGEDTPYAFAVVVENGGSGAKMAGSVAAKVLDAIVNGY